MTISQDMTSVYAPDGKTLLAEWESSTDKKRLTVEDMEAIRAAITLHRRKLDRG